MIKMINVESSMVHSIGYDPETKRLRVKFRDGSLYAYTGVPQSVYDKLMDAQSAQSIGKFIHTNIIGVYEVHKITEVLKKKKRTRK